MSFTSTNVNPSNRNPFRKALNTVDNAKMPSSSTMEQYKAHQAALLADRQRRSYEAAAKYEQEESKRRAGVSSSTKSQLAAGGGKTSYQSLSLKRKSDSDNVTTNRSAVVEQKVTSTTVTYDLTSDDTAVSWSSSPPPRAVPRAVAPAETPNKRILPWAATHSQQRAQYLNRNGGKPTVTSSSPDMSATKSEQETYYNNSHAGTMFAKAKYVMTQEVEAEQSRKRPLGGVNVKQQLILSPEQQRVLQMVTQEKKSVFFTGSAGTGKSVLLREIIANLKRVYGNNADQVAVTASTGIAACNIGGVTVHSFSGIGLGKEPPNELVKKVRKNRKSAGRWARTKVLIIDEVSMVDGELFDKLEYIARELRRSKEPFGGIQLVITGDFFQLPPVAGNKVAKFSFEAQSWHSCIHHTVSLQQVFRQKDQTFIDILNEMRMGRMSAESVRHFQRLNREVKYADGIVPTELFPTREEVERANKARLAAIQEPIVTFHATDEGKLEPEARERLLNNCMAPKVLSLKKGAQVMLIRNLTDSLVNGSIGRIVDFREEMPEDVEDEQMAYKKIRKPTGPQPPGILYPVVDFRLPNGSSQEKLMTEKDGIWKVELPNGEIQAQRSQVPLILAWALSIHKSQGQTIERVKVDLGRVFEKGQAYVALSRATSLDGLQVLRFNESKVMAHPKVIEWTKSLEKIEA